MSAKAEIRNAKPYADAEAYEVYSAILPTEWPWRGANAKSLIIRSETKGYKMCLRPDEDSEKIIGQAISQYVKLNEKNWLLKRGLGIKIRMNLFLTIN